MPNKGTKISSFSRNEISALFKKAKVQVRISGLRILTSSCVGEHGRVLIVTPRKSGSSPQRNLFRRRVKSIFRNKDLYQENIDLVIIVDKRAINISFSQLEKTMLHAIKLYQKNS
jgi:ribonuclease P protein component